MRHNRPNGRVAATIAILSFGLFAATGADAGTKAAKKASASRRPITPPITASWTGRAAPRWARPRSMRADSPAGRWPTARR